MRERGGGRENGRERESERDRGEGEKEREGREGGRERGDIAMREGWRKGRAEIMAQSNSCECRDSLGEHGDCVDPSLCPRQRSLQFYA